ncbi:hexosaminidase D-like isoform X2 [Hydractinia symbiolongicarpus]|uniref:hexosaminidase D-like isoform X2 n=1 Tax=Hydractinia symbiolongicarpus TaxID=13093 RepID=UPI00254F1D29|nr:hexosaminidase D-like isoform X2 [Hydractinia symbiolongicarpus]XP_057289851.1 hexosaminidase D-like isoform X2 [Hydractinia symbiolongicarpus]XP_057289852.1 hexosaminidase D-like isoform X2 [Hydractinia symbiolongicarpus]
MISYVFQRHCWRILKILLFVVSILFLLVWFEYPLQHDAFKGDSELHTRIDELTAKLKRCSHGNNQNRKMLENDRPKIPDTAKKKIQGFSGLRIVHLDLKGAPPKMEYLLQMLPFLKDMGANGLLLEYEDMFPYRGMIRALSSPNTYSYEDIASLLKLAKKLNLEIIPLVQTLGHFEFVLKHDQFRHLRETEQYPNMPCPLHEKTKQIVFKMINQVLELHPDIRRIHLGGDEVFNLKDCEKCKSSKKTKEHLFLHHMIPILKHVRGKTRSKVKPIIWDDMLRKWTVDDMKQFRGLADIMVWGYVPELDNYSLFPEDMWIKYAEAFDKIWVASSYKGALAANNNLVPITMHIKNHESWLRIIKKIKNKVTGVALTGWARYDHFAALCELLPAAIPTLALSLSVLREGSFKKRGKDFVEVMLGFKNPIIIEKDIFGSWDTSIPNYPGGDVYSLVAEYENHVNWYTSTKTRLDSWGNERQVEEKLISILQINGVADSLKQLLPSFKNFRSKCETVLKKYFFEDTVNEWIRDKVDTHIALSEELVDKLNSVLVKLKMKIEL